MQNSADRILTGPKHLNISCQFIYSMGFFLFLYLYFNLFSLILYSFLYPVDSDALYIKFIDNNTIIIIQM